MKMWLWWISIDGFLLMRKLWYFQLYLGWLSRIGVLLSCQGVFIGVRQRLELFVMVGFFCVYRQQSWLWWVKVVVFRQKLFMLLLIWLRNFQVFLSGFLVMLWIVYIWCWNMFRVFSVCVGVVVKQMYQVLLLKCSLGVQISLEYGFVLGLCQMLNIGVLVRLVIVVVWWILMQLYCGIEVVKQQKLLV